MNKTATEGHHISDRDGVTDSVRMQILAAEHWDLLATRSMTWNQIFSRAGMFITLLSAVVVALALVAQATSFDGRFRLFALLILPVLFLLGLATFLHLGEANGEDTRLLVSLARLRQAYIDLAPELQPYLPVQHLNDQAALPPSMGMSRGFSLLYFLGSTPAIVGTINVLVAGVIAALVAESLDAPGVTEVVVGVFVGIIVTLGQGKIVYNRVTRMRREFRSRTEA